VAEKTRLKVHTAIAELCFVRNSAARTLAASRTDTVGLVLTNIGNSLFVDIARGAESAARDAQLKVLLANSDSKTAKQTCYLLLMFGSNDAVGVRPRARFPPQPPPGESSLAANILVVMIPALIMFIFFNRKIVEGMAAGSVKG
jgi:hypothetical protein